MPNDFNAGEFYRNMVGMAWAGRHKDGRDRGVYVRAQAHQCRHSVFAWCDKGAGALIGYGRVACLAVYG